MEICGTHEVTVEVDGELFSVVVRHLPTGRAVGSLAQLGEVLLGDS